MIIVHLWSLFIWKGLVYGQVFNTPGIHKGLQDESQLANTGCESSGIPSLITAAGRLLDGSTKSTPEGLDGPDAEN